MTTFVDTLDFLNDETKALLAQNEFDTAASIAARAEAYFESSPYHLKPGRASRLVAAARQAATSPASVVASRIEIVAPDRERQIAEALRERPVKPRRLLDLGVAWVVQGEQLGEVDVGKTEHMLSVTSQGEDCAGRTWYGSPIVAVSALLPPRWIQPRTGRPLQGPSEDGIDEATLLPWGVLGEDGLRLAVLGEREGFTRGMTDEQVIEALKPDASKPPSSLRVKISARASALKIDLRDIDVVAPANPVRSDGRYADVSIPPLDIPETSIKLTQAGMRELLQLIQTAFTADEVRHLAADLPDGSRIVAALPGGSVGLAHLAFTFVDTVQRWGLTGRLLRNAMVTHCPARRADFDQFFLRIAGRSNPELHGRLVGYLCACFSSGELRRLVSYLPNGRTMVGELPSSELSDHAIADGVARVLDTHGYLNGRAGSAFWDSFRRERPRLDDEINQWQDSLRGAR